MSVLVRIRSVLRLKTAASTTFADSDPGCPDVIENPPSPRLSHWAMRCCALAVLALGACGPARPYYAGYMFNPPRVEETDRSYLVRYLDWKLRSGKVTRVDIQTPDAGTKTLHQSDADTANTDWLPLPALYAAEFVVSTKRKGLELDLMAHMGPEEYVPVTARYEPDGRLVLVLGKPLSSLVPKAEDIPTPDQLKSQYGIGDVRNGTRTWKPYELHSLATALSLLSKEERSVMSGIEFVREAQAKKTIKGLKRNEIWGEFHSPGGPPAPRTINLFDVEAESDTAQFIGEPDHPHPLPSMCLLHEMGHAIADHPRTRMNEECNAQIAEAKKLVAQWNALSAAGKESSPEGVTLGLQILELKKKREEHNLRHERLSASYRRNEGPVHAAYLAVRGPDKGPTRYGRTDVEESFAESFALYKADPEALRRIYPDVLDWFVSGGHLKAMAELE